jgi:hypothetical protein
MTSPMEKARRRPTTAPTLPPVIINEAITSVYRVIAVWMPVTVVPVSAATCRIETFMTELSKVIRNWPEASTISTNPVPGAARRVSVAVTMCSQPNPPLPPGGCSYPTIPYRDMMAQYAPRPDHLSGSFRRQLLRSSCLSDRERLRRPRKASAR